MPAALVLHEGDALSLDGVSKNAFRSAVLDGFRQVKGGYPRTDSRYLTSDMAESLPVLVNLVAKAMPFRKGIAISCDAGAVINDKKVTDHHAVIPTRNLQNADLSGLPVGEKAVLELVSQRLLCAVAEPHTYAETAVTVECAGTEFTAKGRTVKNHGWRALDAAYRAALKNAEPEAEDKALPELTEGQTLPLSNAAIKEGKTSPPKHFTEDTLLSAMETAGKDDMPEDAERKGLGTPATRAGILEKLVSTGFLERKKSKKTVQLMPSKDAVSLITWSWPLACGGESCWGSSGRILIWRKATSG